MSNFTEETGFADKPVKVDRPDIESKTTSVKADVVNKMLQELSDEQREAAGAAPDVIRLSIGLETVDDLLADLDQGMSQAGKK